VSGHSTAPAIAIAATEPAAMTHCPVVNLLLIRASAARIGCCWACGT
jgi:hypothetical protein